MRMAPRDHSSAVKGGAAQSGRTGWHSAAASALEATFKKPTISRAKRSAAMPGWAAGLDSEARICTQPEELRADIGSRLPSAIIPLGTAQIITAIENLSKHDIAKLRDGHHGRTFHLDRETTIFVSSARNFCNGLTIGCISRPCFSDTIGNTTMIERLYQHLHAGFMGLNFARWCKVVI